MNRLTSGVWKLVLCFGWCVCFYYGSIDAAVWLTNRSPLKTTCAEYLANKPQAQWLELAECYINYTHYLTYRSTASRGRTNTDTHYVALRPNEADRSEIRIIMEVTDAEKLSLLRQLDKATEQNAGSLIMAHLDELLCVETVTGLIESGSLRAGNREIYEAMEEADVGIAEDCVIIMAGAKPAGRRALLILGAGVIWAALVLRRFVGRSQREPAPEPDLQNELDDYVKRQR